MLDTCILIDGLAEVDEPACVSVISMVELVSGFAAVTDVVERARRQERYDRLAAAFDPLPVDGRVLARYGRIDAAVRVLDRRPRRRLADLLIAATAAAHGVPLLTDNAEDFRGLDGLVEVRTRAAVHPGTRRAPGPVPS